jgi:hypothetical protein
MLRDLLRHSNAYRPLPYYSTCMVETVNLYMDDSGTRHPDRKPGKSPAHGRDWFALGGILVQSEQEMYEKFLADWPQIRSPLHSSEIRAKSEGFRWLTLIPQGDQERFYEELYRLMAVAPVVGIACVIDRPGYNARYAGYADRKWLLCKTAFSVAVERSAKWARARGRKLRVNLERGDRDSDQRANQYYRDLKNQGTPFAADTSGKYTPLQPAEFRETLYEFRVKFKTSPLIQFADLYLWPMCMGGYQPDNRPYARLMSDKKIIDAQIDTADIPTLGIKYSCWDLVKAKVGKN